MNLNGEKIRLSSLGDIAQHPLVSPDGMKIAYLIQGPNPPGGSPFYRLYVTDLDFSNSVLLEAGLIQDFTWKNNSQEIIYSLYDHSNNNSDLWECSIISTQKKRFTQTPENEENPNYSSNGKYLAFTIGQDLYVTETHNFQPTKISINSHNPRWIPNKNLILVDKVESIDYQSFWTESWILDIKGNITKKIAEGKNTNSNPSACGNYIAYSLAGNIWIDQIE